MTYPPIDFYFTGKEKFDYIDEELTTFKYITFKPEGYVTKDGDHVKLLFKEDKTLSDTEMIMGYLNDEFHYSFDQENGAIGIATTDEENKKYGFGVLFPTEEDLEEMRNLPPPPPAEDEEEGA